ncbi:MAG: hypothetical protein GEU93_00080 [Propionibacteriales bacterium]|nr:hypothetical protein [Propionibacteriales bacterium]
MNTPTRLGGYLAVLALIFGAGTLLGDVLVDAGTVERAESETAGDHDSRGGDHAAKRDAAGDDTATEAMPAGLMISQHGYTLDIAQRTAPAARGVPLRFRIVRPDSAPVTEYDETHGRDLHLIAVRRDMAGFQHVHPVLDDSGTWRTRLDLSHPGPYRIFADFVATGHDMQMTLASELVAVGDYQPRPLPEPDRTAHVDGYEVTLDSGLAAGEGSELTFSVSRDGRPVTDLQPYLAAYGHLVALRDGDLAYLHVHPEGEPGDGTTESGPRIAFHATTPSAGDYRLFLQFRHDDAVHTAEFTVRAGEAATHADDAGEDDAGEGGGHDDH